MVKDNITLLSKNESADVEVSLEEQAQVSTTFRRTDQCHGPSIKQSCRLPVPFRYSNTANAKGR
jgi:hypothetical protein